MKMRSEVRAEAQACSLIDQLRQRRRAVSLLVEVVDHSLGDSFGTSRISEDEVRPRSQLIDRKEFQEFILDVTKLLMCLHIIIEEGRLQLLDGRGVLPQDPAVLPLLCPNVLK